MIGRIRALRAVRAHDRGATLTELLIGTLIGAMLMSVVATMIFTSNGLSRRADDRSQFASDLSIASLSFDRDGVMATAGAPAKSQAGIPTCATTIDLGFLEGGASVRYRTVAGAPFGPSWLQRVSGSGTRTIVKNVSGCTWQSIQVGAGRFTIVMNLVLTGTSGETLTQSLRVAPRSW
jgi:hypothetical protein